MARTPPGAVRAARVRYSSASWSRRIQCSAVVDTAAWMVGGSASAQPGSARSARSQVATEP
ncbi:hypothetical protein ACTXG6_18260 [Pseudonocardia sp. Cha107L01]|uniref:hypothetical protein n=1 Tax=Pseudonocardia sp. Cha107L01 TaxID=3457576 RepID=UPI00403E866A